MITFSLEGKKGSKWSTAAGGSSGNSVQNINVQSNAGKYRWKVYSLSGSENFTLCTNNP